MRAYAPVPKMYLVQTTVKASVLKKINAVAKTTGRTRSGYLRHILDQHMEPIMTDMYEDLRDFEDATQESPAEKIAKAHTAIANAQETLRKFKI